MIRLIYISWYDIPSTWTIMHGWWWCWYSGYVWFIGVSFRFLLVWTLNVLKGEWLHKAQRDRVIYGDTEVSITRGTCLVLASPDERVVTIHLARTGTNLAMVPSARYGMFHWIWYVQKKKRCFITCMHMLQLMEKFRTWDHVAITFLFRLIHFLMPTYTIKK